MIFKGKVIVKEFVNEGIYNYKVIENILDFEKGDCIIVKSMNPDFSILLNQINIIISEKGSPLSHLAIIAREYNKTVVIVDNIIDKISKKGILSISYDNENTKIKID
jgi:phosphohistidine swiveling domain-containing protein